MNEVGVRAEFVGLVIPVAIDVSPDGSPFGLIRWPVLLCAVEIVSPLENKPGRNCHLVVVPEDVNEIAGEHSADKKEPSSLQVYDLRRRKSVLAVLFHECQTSRVVRILVSIE